MVNERVCVFFYILNSDIIVHYVDVTCCWCWLQTSLTFQWEGFPFGVKNPVHSLSQTKSMNQSRGRHTHTHRRTHTVFFDVSVICLCRAFRGLFQNIRQHWEDENGTDRNKAKICSILHGICTVSYSSCLLDVENLTWNKPQALFSGRAEWTPRKLALILISYIAKVEGQHSPKTYVWHHSLYL